MRLNEYERERSGVVNRELQVDRPDRVGSAALLRFRAAMREGHRPRQAFAIARQGDALNSITNCNAYP